MSEVASVCHGWLRLTQALMDLRMPEMEKAFKNIKMARFEVTGIKEI